MCNACAGEDLFLPCPTAEPKKKRLGKRQRASHPYQYLTKRKDGSCARREKGEETVVLSLSKFLGEIKAYLLGLTRADCNSAKRGYVVQMSHLSCQQPFGH